ncbi:uncharacterized protein [Dendrobates tinctorius]|uniref:uncharacterized protein isoform X1 n=1 Tax=Dendrobates tinctorius TaxID=92724 RepID=UPI003CCA2B80
MNIPRGIGRDNLSRDERSRLDVLRGLPDVVLKPADKGGNVVIWPKLLYEKEALRQLNNNICYKRLTFNPLLSFVTQLNKILDLAVSNGVITKELAGSLKVQEPTIATFYLLPKVHKSLEAPPGRPIISGSGNYLERVNRWIDSKLQPLVESLPSFLLDTGEFLKRIDGLHIGIGTMLVTGDVESLYTSIRHKDGLSATKYFLNMSNLPLEIVSLVLELLEFSLTHNFFTFMGSFYLQLQGTAMGASFAPSYANLFLGLWERDLPLSDQYQSMDRIPLWVRYIDDIFLVWQGNEVQLSNFMERINSNDRNIHLTYQYDMTKVSFLDVNVWRDNDNILQTSIFRKETSSNMLLHASSAHPKSLINSIPIGQFLRLRRICSSDKDFESQAQDLSDRFLERGYSRRAIKRAHNRARWSTRQSLLYKQRDNRSCNKIRFITNYHAQFSKMRSCLQRAWPILQTDPILNQLIPHKPSITIRRSMNLKDYLVRSHYQSEPKQTFLNVRRPRCGCAPCGRCVACPNIDQADAFFNSSRNRTFTIRHRISCTTRYVIYFALCPCNLIYVGMTTRPLKIRVREHVLGIQAAVGHDDPATLRTLPRHFKFKHDCDASLLRVRGIDAINPGVRGGNLTQRLLQCETRWIWLLDTVHPKGLNEAISFAPFL